MAYLLDTNVLIAAKNDHYGFDFCPALWSWLDESNGAGVVRSVERVFDELIELSEWARARRPFFLPLSAEDVRAVAEINRWSNDSPDYDPAAKAELAGAADSFLVAQAKAGNHTIVTHERISDGRKRIKIRNAAAAHGVEWCTPFHMLRVERARFVP